jgi:DNA-binding CsgD family transcriptional regulator
MTAPFQASRFAGTRKPLTFRGFSMKFDPLFGLNFDYKWWKRQGSFDLGKTMWLVGINTVSGNLPFRLVNGSFVVGRTKKARIVIAEATVSRRHARLTRDGERITVEDLASSNGTYVNEAAVSQSQLKMGDHIRFGSVACAISPSPLFLGTLTEEESTYQIPKTGETTQINRFTAAQQAIIPHLMAGRSEPEIAAILGKSRHTIHSHIRAIFERVGAHSREELIVKLVKNQ